MDGAPWGHVAPLTRWNVTVVPSGLTSHVLASEPISLPEPSRRTRPSYRLSRRIVAIDAVASAVGSSDVGSWVKAIVALGLDDTADDAAGAGEAAAIAGLGDGAATAALGDGAATAALADGAGAAGFWGGGPAPPPPPPPALRANP